MGHKHIGEPKLRVGCQISHCSGISRDFKGPPQAVPLEHSHRVPISNHAICELTCESSRLWLSRAPSPGRRRLPAPHGPAHSLIRCDGTQEPQGRQGLQCASWHLRLRSQSVTRCVICLGFLQKNKEETCDIWMVLASLLMHDHCEMFRTARADKHPGTGGHVYVMQMISDHCCLPRVHIPFLED